MGYRSTALIPLLALAACGSSSGARFADATEVELHRIFVVASGLDAFRVHDLWEQMGPTQCPVYEQSAQGRVYTGGCTDADGHTWTGQITRATSLDTGDWTVNAEGFGVAAGAESFTLDGDASRTSGIGGDFEIRDAMSTDVDAVAIDLDLTLACDPGFICTAAESSTLDVDGVGSAAIEGMWNLGVSAGEVVVRGADELRFDVSHRDGDCVPYVVGDRTGTVCGLL
jgi:hypothetical protein